ncbi:MULTISPECIES: YopX family protein [Pseudomonadati]|uniref:YopX family protein n=1 Tax=Pseudomonadati TaxID=3379134 RepID=UPI0019D51167|nr:MULTISPECIES: YopX family protein [Bacteria]
MVVPKFRAWGRNGNYPGNPSEKFEMFYDVSVVTTYKDNEQHVIADFGMYNESEYNGTEIIDYTLMQSTGLFDKNGKEIFEGDIVRYTWDMLSDQNATEKGKKVRISKVFWSDWRASWAVGRKFCNSDLFRYARNGNTVEIIGDVYQNPELLEETDDK